MDYLFLAVAVVCIGFQFVCTKLYQKRAGATLFSTAVFGAGSGAVACLIFAIATLFSVQINLFSACISLALAVCSTASTCAGIKAVSCGKVAVFTQFMMLGGMLVPFVYGVCVWQESAGVWRYVALVLLIASLVLPCIEQRGQKNSALFYVLCVVGFLCNGAVSVLSKTHQIGANAVPTFDFMVAVYGFTAVLNVLLCAIAVAVRKRKAKATLSETEPSVPAPQAECAAAEKAPKGKKFFDTALVVAAYAAVNSGGYVMQLLGARSLPAVLLYPAVTGGTVVLSAIFGRLFFGEKISKWGLGGILLAFAATCLFLL